jgi:hypothetical protein
MNQSKVTGLLFIVIATAFGAGSFTYDFGTFERPGPAMLPLIVSLLLFAIGSINLFKHSNTTVTMNIKNITIITSSLIAFAAVISCLDLPLWK